MPDRHVVARSSLYSTEAGFTVWLTGMSGAGKSSIADHLARHLRNNGRRVEVLDGDEVRQTLWPDLGFSDAERELNVARLGWLARVLAHNGVAVIVAAISPTVCARERVRAAHKMPFIEVHVDCPLHRLIERDTKGLYAKALDGSIRDFTGISSRYEPPPAPQVYVNTDDTSIDDCVSTIIHSVARFITTVAAAVS